MCGIFGIVGASSSHALDEQRFGAGLATLAHRGPDGDGIERIADDVIFGHRRLAIIDLTDDSKQPFTVCGRYWLTFNGEIFNFIELRDELRAQGVSFSTEGDVEVLLQAYSRWGEECVQRFNGMWAFAIYDRETGRLFASRDRFGIKPFNYCLDQGQLIFASEIKAMLAYRPDLAEPDYNMIGNFCRTSVGAQHPQTWFRRVTRLMPGHNLTFEQGKLTISRYWDYPEGIDTSMSYAQAKASYRELFEDSVRLRMRSDVPMGITLSAGIDSNSIVHAMHAHDPRPYYCLTSRFADSEGLVQEEGIFVDTSRPIDEAQVAARVASTLSMHSEIVETSYAGMVERLRHIIRHLESGNSAPAVLPLMQLYAHARNYMTVVMDGQGADELLAGYITAVFFPAQIDLLKRGRLSEFREGLKEYRKTYTLKTSLLMGLRYLSNAMPFVSTLHQRRSGLDRIYAAQLTDGYERMADWPDLGDGDDPDLLTAVLRRQHAGGLVNLLHYGDALSMANSLEARMPFLDHRLVEFVWRLPSDYKVKLGVGKAIHRDAMRGLVPDSILDDRSKWGFATPISRQFRDVGEHSSEALAVLLDERSLARGLFDAKGLKQMIADHQASRADHGPLLLRLLMTELWFREFIDQNMVTAAQAAEAA